MSNGVFLLKPSRFTDVQPALDSNLIQRNLVSGIETTVVLDLNVLNSFKDFVAPNLAKSEDLLLDVTAIKEVLKTPGLYITPGFALGEADESYLEVLRNTYEQFLSEECPTYVDAPNATNDFLDRTHARKYRNLPPSDQQFYGSTYLALLKIHDIILSEWQSPEAKFDSYLEFMHGVANFVPGLETEVAKYLFCDPSEFQGTDFANTCKAIRNNFNKGGAGEKRVDGILNGARDIMYIRSAAMMDGKQLDGCKQDTWLLTRDTGIAHFIASIYFYPAEGERSKYTTVSANKTRQVSSYWRYVDKTSQLLLEGRQLNHKNANGFADGEHLKALACRALSMSKDIAARL